MASSTRCSTWYYFLVLMLAVWYLENSCHEMYLSKLVFFASWGVWARDMSPRWRRVQLSIAAGLCLLLLGSWYHFRNQQVTPIAKGVYLVKTR